MKFDNYKYWKHENCIDVFICVSSSITEGDKTALNIFWFTQGTEGFWPTVQDIIKINQENYKKWHPYEPKGEYKF